MTTPPRRRRRENRAAVAPAVVAPPVVAAVEPVNHPDPARAKAWSRMRVSHYASQVALVVMLALALGASWRDGAPTDDYGLTGPVPSAAAPTFVSGRDAASGAQPLAAGSVLVPPEPAVPTARPLLLLIPALDVHRAVEAVGVGRSGVLNLPQNSWNAGWYKGGPVPGAPGDAVIEGHAGYPGQPMIFGRLGSLRRGDAIIVVLGDGTRQVFRVDSMSTIAIGTAPPGMGEPYGPPRLTLITCTGHFDKTSYSYSQRLVLEAHYAGLA